MSDKRIYMITDDGKPVLTISGHIGSAGRKIQDAYRLIVDNQGFIAVVDDVNSNVVLLSPSLTYVRELISADKGLPRNPFRMYFQESRSLHFVAGLDVGLLSVFKGETKYNSLRCHYCRYASVRLTYINTIHVIHYPVAYCKTK